MKKINTHALVLLSFLTALSFVLFMFEFPVFPPLKMDFSDVPVMVAGYMMGGWAGILVAFFKNVLHFFFISGDNYVGELANFAFAVLVMLPYALLKNRIKSKHWIIQVTAVFSGTILMNVFNYFVTMPLFHIPLSARLNLIFMPYIPFNLIKSTVLVLIFAVLLRFLDRKRR